MAETKTIAPMSIQVLRDGYHRFRNDDFPAMRAQFERLAQEGQHPVALFLGCSDSRVVPELFTRAAPGTLFVVRNVANLVPPAGTYHNSVGAAVEYAVGHLHVPTLIVCGHYDCGGIKALDQPEAFVQAHDPSLAAWLSHARPAQLRVDARGAVAEARHAAIVEENVLLQLEHLQTYTAVQDALRARKLELHGWVYDIGTGVVRAYNPASRRFEFDF
jgi:carbonic anhydrase